MNIWGFETAPNVQTLSKEWNKKTSDWLTRYVYIRTNGSLNAVYGLSAVWHGFYPGYFMFFMSAPLVTVCERLKKKKISPCFSKEKWSLYGIATMLVTSVTVGCMASPYPLLAFITSWSNWKSHYFLGIWDASFSTLAFRCFQRPRKKRSSKSLIYKPAQRIPKLCYVVASTLKNCFY
jgi:hypothetical protein